MKRFLTILLVLSLLLTFASCGRKDSDDDSDRDHEEYSEKEDKNEADDDTEDDSEDSTDKEDEKSEEESKINAIIASAGTDAVTYEIVSNDGVYAKIVAQVPNYTELFAKALTSNNPEKFLATAITNNDFTTVEYTGNANIATSPDGKEIICSDELIEGFVEQELIKAINTILESEKGDGE